MGECGAPGDVNSNVLIARSTGDAQLDKAVWQWLSWDKVGVWRGTEAAGTAPSHPTSPGGGFSAFPRLFCHRSRRVCPLLRLLPILPGAFSLPGVRRVPSAGPFPRPPRGLGVAGALRKNSSLDPARSPKAAVTEKFLSCRRGKARYAAIQGLYLTMGWYDVILLAHGVRHLLRVATASSLRQKRASCEMGFKEGLFDGLKCS